MVAADLLRRLKGVEEAGDGRWMALCPAHSDHKPSLSIADRDGKLLLHCHAGCSIEAVLGALDLKMADLVEREEQKAAPRIAATYDYRDEGGTLLFQVVRKEPKGFFQRRPNGTGGWINDMTDVRRVLYRLPELLAADPAATVFVVEGEKDADRLGQLGLLATTNPGGAGHWHSEYSERLRRRDVVIISDNDEAGRKHAKQVANALAGVAASVRIVNLPGVPEKGNVGDFLNSGHEEKDLLKLAMNAPEEQDRSEPRKRVAHLSDLGNAQRLVEKHGQDLRYSHDMGKWLYWNDKRWAIDDTGEVMRRATHTVQQLYEEASRQEEKGRRSEAAEHALRSESAAACKRWSP